MNLNPILAPGTFGMNASIKPLAYGVDTARSEYYSLRQARYDALGEDVGRMAREFAAEGKRLNLLDIGVHSGTSRRHIDRRAGSEAVDFSGADLWVKHELLYKNNAWRELFEGDFQEGYPQIPSNAYDVVVCEQILEHLHHLETPVRCVERVLKPGGIAFIGVPIFTEGPRWVREHIVPKIDAINPWAKKRGHVQAFSQRTFLNVLRKYTSLEVKEVRGFRMISGGLLRRLENYRWWWALNRKLGAALPSFCAEIQVIAQKPHERSRHAPRAAAA